MAGIARAVQHVIVGSGGHIRRNHGRVTVTASPQTKSAGRRSTVTAEVVPRDEHEDVLVRLVDARLERSARAYCDREGIETDLRNPHNLRNAIYRARQELARVGRQEDAKLADEALCTRHGEALAQDLAIASDPMRSTVIEVAREYVAAYLERRPQTSEDLDLLLQRARARAGARAVWRQLLRIGLASPSMSRTVKHQDGSTVRTMMPSGAELLGRMTALDESAMRAGLTVDARIATQRERGGLQVTSDMQARLERVLAEEADRYRAATKALAEKSTTSETVEAPSAATDSRESVAVPAVPTTSDVPLVPAREQSAPVAPSASPAAPPSAPAPSTPASAPSAPRGDQAPASTVAPMADEDRLRALCREWIANSGRKTLEEAQRCNELQTKAEAIVMARYEAAQDAERRWQQSGRRGRLPVAPLHVPWPASRWFAEQGGHESDYAKRAFGWTYEPEPQRKR